MSKSLIPAQRRERIQEYLALHKIARTVDLCSMLDASEATVRRDLEWLEKDGVLEKTHGGAILSQHLNIEPEYRQRAQHNPEAKRRIGAIASSLIEKGDMVFINSGTTTNQVIHQIRNDAEISIFTNNFNAAHEMDAPGFHHYLVGGEYQPRSKSIAGRFAMDNLEQVYANKVIIGVDGISLKYGCTVPTNAEAEVIKKMIERTTGSIIIVADHSKWGVVSNFQISTIDEIDVLITDEAFDKSAFKSLEKHSVKIMIAKEN